MAKCFKCGAVLDYVAGPIGRGEVCAKCLADVRCCLNCNYYERDSYNQCAEPNAERVVDKEKANFCDYFALSQKSGTHAIQESSAALKKLDDLFRK